MLPTLLKALIESSAAMQAMVENKLQLVNTAFQIAIRDPAATRPKALLGGSSRLAVIIHTDGSVQVSFGNMRSQTEEGKVFSSELANLINISVGLGLQLPSGHFPTMLGSVYELGETYTKDGIGMIKPRQCPIRLNPRYLTPRRQNFEGCVETEFLYNILGTTLHEWSSGGEHEVVPLRR